MADEEEKRSPNCFWGGGLEGGSRDVSGWKSERRLREGRQRAGCNCVCHGNSMRLPLITLPSQKRSPRGQVPNASSSPDRKEKGSLSRMRSLRRPVTFYVIVDFINGEGRVTETRTGVGWRFIRLSRRHLWPRLSESPATCSEYGVLFLNWLTSCHRKGVLWQFL